MNARWLLGLVVVGALLALSGPAILDARQARLSLRERSEALELVALVDETARGKPPGGAAWLKWRYHFLRGTEGRTYIPFTLRIDEAPDAFDSVALYVRLSRVGGERRSIDQANAPAAFDMPTGGEMLPASVPESQFGTPGIPTAGEHSMALNSVAAALIDRPRHAFEDIHFVADLHDRSEPPYEIVRAIEIPPGAYDVYLAVLERDPSVDVGGKHRTAVMKQRLVVPDFGAVRLRTSSLLLADAIAPLEHPLSETEQRERPYALGLAEVEPAADALFDPSEEMTVAFFVYNATAAEGGKPDVRIDYQFVERGLTERVVSRTPPQILDATTLPADFDLAAGHQLATSQTVPLASFAQGDYRLRVTVTDRLSGETAVEEIEFSVRPGAE